MKDICFGAENSVDALSTVDTVEDCSVFIYCDPPYVDTVAKYNKNWSIDDDT